MRWAREKVEREKRAAEEERKQAEERCAAVAAAEDEALAGKESKRNLKGI